MFDCGCFMGRRVGGTERGMDEYMEERREGWMSGWRGILCYVEKEN